VNGEERIYGRGDDFGCVQVIPGIKTRSTSPTPHLPLHDGGKTFTASKALRRRRLPTIWINPTIPTSSPSPSIKAQPSASTAPNLELLVQPAHARSITSSRQPVSYWVYGGSRKAAPSAPPAAATSAKSPFAIGPPSASKNTATSRPILASQSDLRRQSHRLRPQHRTNPRRFPVVLRKATTVSIAPRRSSSRRRSPHPLSRIERPLQTTDGATVGKSSALT